MVMVTELSSQPEMYLTGLEGACAPVRHQLLVGAERLFLGQRVKQNEGRDTG